MGRRLSPPRRSCGSGRPPGRAELAACAASRWPPAPCRAHENRAAGCTCTARAGRRAAPGPMLRPPEQRTRPVPSKAASSGDPSLRSGTVCVKVACECATKHARPAILDKHAEGATSTGSFANGARQADRQTDANYGPLTHTRRIVPFSARCCWSCCCAARSVSVCASGSPPKLAWGPKQLGANPASWTQQRPNVLTSWILAVCRASASSKARVLTACFR